MTVLAFAQGAYYFITGLWSLVHIDSFQKVTGRKTDLWLVKTVGILLVALGTGLILAGLQQEFGVGLIFIAMATCAGLITIELTYVSKRVIAPIYLADAAVEAGFISWWAGCFLNA
jgi:hypothetical protein